MGSNRRVINGPRGLPGAPGAPGAAGPAGDSWTKFTVTFQNFIDSVTGIVTISTLGSLQIVENAIAKCSTAFISGGNPVYLRLRAVSASAPDDTLIEQFVADSAVSISNLNQSHFLYAESLNASDVVLQAVVEFNAEGGSVASLTAGVVEIWVKLTALP